MITFTIVFTGYLSLTIKKHIEFNKNHNKICDIHMGIEKRAIIHNPFNTQTHNRPMLRSYEIGKSDSDIVKRASS